MPQGVGARLGWALCLGSWWFDTWAKSVKGDFVCEIYQISHILLYDPILSYINNEIHEFSIAMLHAVVYKVISYTGPS